MRDWFTTPSRGLPSCVREWLALAGRLTAIGGILTVGFVALLVLATLIPNEPIIEHLKEARPYLRPHRAASPIPGRPIGTRGECIWLSLGVAPSDDPGVLSRAIRASAIEAPEQCLWLSHWLRGGQFRGRDYFRYWHGYQIVTRPLLWATGYPVMRALNAAAVLGLFLGLMALVWRRLGARPALCLVASAALMRFENPLFTLNHGAAWIIALAAAILVLSWSGTAQWRAEFFFVVGALTTYFDLLTNPLATLALPLLVIALGCQNGEERPAARQVRNMVFCGAMWALGYFGMWTVKFVLDVWVVGPGAWDNIVNQAVMHTVGETRYGRHTAWLSAVHNVAWYLRPAWRFWCVVAIVAVLLVRSLDAPWRQPSRWVGLALVAVLPFLWFAVFAHHSTLWSPVTSRYLFFTLAVFLFGATAPLSPTGVASLGQLRDM